MNWIRAHFGSISLAVAALCGIGSGVGYGQMVYYNNYEAANWITVAAWFLGGAVALVCFVVGSSSFPRLASVSAQGTLSRVRQLREQAIASRKSADASDAAAAKAIAELDAELEASRAIMPEVAK